MFLMWQLVCMLTIRVREAGIGRALAGASSRPLDRNDRRRRERLAREQLALIAASTGSSLRGGWHAFAGITRRSTCGTGKVRSGSNAEPGGTRRPSARRAYSEPQATKSAARRNFPTTDAVSSARSRSLYEQVTHPPRARQRRSERPGDPDRRGRGAAGHRSGGDHHRSRRRGADASLRVARADGTAGAAEEIAFAYIILASLNAPATSTVLSGSRLVVRRQRPWDVLR